MKQVNEETMKIMMDEIDKLENKERLRFSDLLKSECADVFKNISENINSTNPRQIIYHAKINSNVIPTCNCGKQVGWHPDTRSYRRFCSKQCTAKYTVEEKKEKNLANHGVEWHTQLNEWKEKVEQTSVNKFGVSHYSKTGEYLKRRADSNVEKYGVSHVMQLDSVKQKCKSTNLKKFGVDNPLQSPEIQDRIKNTNMDRYGVINPLQSDIVQHKIKQTNLKKFNVENVLSNKDIRNKASCTRRKNLYTPEQLTKLNDLEWLTNEHHSGKPIWSIANDIGVSASNLCKHFNTSGITIKHFSKSELETRLLTHYTHLGFNIIQNSRNIISPKEIDLYFPDFNLAVEINGCYYHSEKFIQSPSYHNEKLSLCLEKNIQLLQFWDYEFNEKWDQVINIINSHLKINNTIYARNTSICLISHKDKEEFITKHHLQGDVNSKINLGLMHNNQLVLVASFGSPRFLKNKKNTFELLRLCSVSGTQVVGGASKIMKYFIKNFMSIDNVLISYCDKRYSIGKVYNAIGFTQIASSPPSFFYINKQGKYAGTRYKWQKHLMGEMLPNFDPTFTAVDNMKLHGYHRVWDCGQLVFSLTKSN